jgi:HK97 family phage major capsid protein
MMRRRAFQGSGPEIEQRYARAGQWLLAAIFESAAAREWCAKHDVRLVKAQGESVGTTGGFVVPTELANAILDLREQYGAFRRTARIVPMASDSLHTPRRPGGTGAFFMGEGAAAAESSAAVDNLGLNARKIGTLIRLSTEIAEDSLIDIVDFVANEVAYAFASKEDDCAFNGDGTSTFGKMRGLSTIMLDGTHGASKVTAAGGHNTFAILDASDVSSLISAVRASAIPNASWFVSQTGFALTFCRLAATGGYLDTAVIDGVRTLLFLGFPVVLCQKLPLVTTTLSGKVMMGFGDMYAAGALGQRRGVTLARSPDRYLDQDQLAILGTERFHAVLHDLGDNTNPGAIAALVAP